MVDNNDDNLDDARPRRRRKRARPTSSDALVEVATSRSAIGVYVLLGTLGLAALAVAMVGPKRVRREVLEPIRDAVEPRARKAWEDSATLRRQVTDLLEKAGPAERRALARSFRGWIGRFGAE